ncbi:phospholipase A [Robertkochia aurantiaca]|uniref:phospholipase A n=1 Tax=Robertkochia aurantiaca TaxID=2873700 RepID=UPI001CD010EE|nr:phospholipase A [Robertkochia sp. 3YJGBD-33]
MLYACSGICTAVAQNTIDSSGVITKTFSERWELDREDKKGTFRLISYKPTYFTAARWSSDPNTMPVSENPEYNVDERRDYNKWEAKFQLSFKTKVLQSFLWGYGDLWVTFTQVAHWQLYNPELSRPFRELNYEPEVLLNFPMKVDLFGGKLRMAGVAFNHESNGRDIPRSRSWNRVIFHLGYEHDKLQLYLRPWVRVGDDDDENPEISHFIGRGELTAIYTLNQHALYLVGTNNFNVSENRGSLQLNYLFPIQGNLRGQAQFFHGYGETLIDYNHLQTTFGIGVSFIDW